MTECPKCKGTEGYFYELIVQYHQECNWEGEPTAAEVGGGAPNREGRMLECVECGARFRRNTIDNG